MTAAWVLTLLALPPAFPLEKVSRGQRGECHTVFEGEEIETFPFVVKGLMPDFLGPKRDLVLVRLEGEKAEFTGVVAGMSGSPCYLDGKLLGALSYAFAAFAKEPIAGITPLKSMTDVLELPGEPRPWRLAQAQTRQDWSAFAAGQAPAQQAADGLPIATPLGLGGFPPAVRNYFDPYLRGVGFEPMAAGTGQKGAAPKALVPGGAVAAVLVSGDVDIAATGTVTVVDGNRVLAFGHPFFGAGSVSIPMASATILNTMVSSLRSFKMSATGPLVGEVTQDRLSAIAGVLGPVPRMIPVQGRVRTAAGEQRFHFGVARDAVLTPRLLAMASAAALAGRLEAGARGLVRLRAKIEAKGLPPLVFEEVYAAERDPSLFVHAGIDVALTVAYLWSTPFAPPPDLAVELEVTHEAEPIEEWIEGMHVDRAQVEAGQAVEIAVQLRRNQGGTRLERFHLPVPREWAGQKIELIAAGATEAEQAAGKVEATPWPTSLPEVVTWLERRRPNGRLYLLAVRKGPGLQTSQGVNLFLPPSAVATLSGDPSRQVLSEGLAWEEHKSCAGVVYGRARAELAVIER